jgi:lipoate-protein ligase B
MAFQYNRPKGIIYNLGVSSYQRAYNFQKKIFEKKLNLKRIDEFLIICRHHPVFTVGRNSRESSGCFEGLPLVRIERGGGMTYHGPEQLVFYPIFDLSRLKIKKIARFIFLMEEAAKRTLIDWGIKGFRRKGFPGLWIEEDKKIFSLGVYIRRWITMHGGALIVNRQNETCLNNFSPCGLAEARLVSMEEVLNRGLSIQDVKGALIKNISDVFNIDWKDKNV